MAPHPSLLAVAALFYVIRIFVDQSSTWPYTATVPNAVAPADVFATLKNVGAVRGGIVVDIVIGARAH